MFKLLKVSTEAAICLMIFTLGMAWYILHYYLSYVIVIALAIAAHHYYRDHMVKRKGLQEGPNVTHMEDKRNGTD